MKNILSINLLKEFSPLDTFNFENIKEVCRQATVLDLMMGHIIFKKEDNDQKHYYLLEGKIDIFEKESEPQTVEAGSSEAKQPIAQYQPRQHTAVAKTNCKVCCIDSEVIDILLTWEQTSEGETNEATMNNSDDSDWMNKVLESQIFTKIPPTNIHAIFTRMEPFKVSSGDVITKEGSKGDYYYLIKKGSCKITRKDLTIATLNAGDTFGEEALLGDIKRNATVIMTANGTLLRLSHKDFNDLLKEPILNWVEPKKAIEMIAAGAIWLDVRLPNERRKVSLKGALNIPLSALRLESSKLDSQKTYIIYCDTGRRSSVGAFLLQENGFQAYCLKYGLMSIVAAAEKRANRATNT